MSALRLLAVLNWCMAAIYGGCVLVLGAISQDFKLTAIVGIVCLPFFLMHCYLGQSIAQARGRVLQTVVAVFSLMAFPIGTGFGVFAIAICWFSDSAKLFSPRRP